MHHGFDKKLVNIDCHFQNIDTNKKCVLIPKLSTLRQWCSELMAPLVNRINMFCRKTFIS